MVIFNLRALFGSKPVKAYLKDWSRLWIEGGFRGAVKKFTLNDGTVCRTMIKYGFIAIYCLSEEDSDKSSGMVHILSRVSIENLTRFFSIDDANEIYQIYCFLN